MLVCALRKGGAPLSMDKQTFLGKHYLKPVKAEGKGSCWHISVLLQVHDFLPGTGRNLDIVGREMDFRVRWYLAKQLIKGMLLKDWVLDGSVLPMVIRIMEKLLQVPVANVEGSKGFDPSSDGWQGCTCHSLLAQ